MTDQSQPHVPPQPPLESLRRWLRGLYFGSDTAAIRFQVMLLTVDLAILLFFLAGPYLRTGPAYLLIDYSIALIIACELSARIIIAPSLRYWLMRPLTWVDIVILGTLLFPNQLHNFAFLRVLRIWAISQSKLYFTVATVTTTGFGDITLPGTLGKLTSIVTMIIGISLFVRLAQTIVRPYKVTYPCPQCGLQRHDADAVHCKACGHILNIPDEGT